jgi:hypothetical protein
MRLEVVGEPLGSDNVKGIGDYFGSAQKRIEARETINPRNA